MRRRRLRLVAGWLRRVADRVYPEPLHTLQITTPAGTRTFIDCREYVEGRQERASHLTGPYQVGGPVLRRP